MRKVESTGKVKATARARERRVPAGRQRTEAGVGGPMRTDFDRLPFSHVGSPTSFSDVRSIPRRPMDFAPSQPIQASLKAHPAEAEHQSTGIVSTRTSTQTHHAVAVIHHVTLSTSMRNGFSGYSLGFDGRAWADSSRDQRWRGRGFGSFMSATKLPIPARLALHRRRRVQRRSVW